MSRSFRWLHILLEVIGGIAVVSAVAALVVWLGFIKPMENFAGGNCTDTEQEILASPGGKHTAKTYHRVCGSDGQQLYSGYSVFLSTGNPNKGYEYTPIVGIKDVAPHQVSVAWDGPDQLSVSYPLTAKLEDVYATVLGVMVVMEPRSGAAAGK
jgi:hypothetical protein